MLLLPVEIMSQLAIWWDRPHRRPWSSDTDLVSVVCGLGSSSLNDRLILMATAATT